MLPAAQPYATDAANRPTRGIRWTVFSEAIMSWPATLRLALLPLAWSVLAALIIWLARR